MIDEFNHVCLRNILIYLDNKTIYELGLTSHHMRNMLSDVLDPCQDCKKANMLCFKKQCMYCQKQQLILYLANMIRTMMGYIEQDTGVINNVCISNNRNINLSNRQYMVCDECVPVCDICETKENIKFTCRCKHLYCVDHEFTKCQCSNGNVLCETCMYKCTNCDAKLCKDCAIFQDDGDITEILCRECCPV